MFIHYTVEENIFVVIVQKYLTEEVLKRHHKDSFKINGKQMIKMPKMVNTLNSKIMKEK